MIAFIRGRLLKITDIFVVVDVHGVGYKLECANPYAFQNYINEEVFIHTYHHVREDHQSLYGFKTEDEKSLFEKLISVSGIGPKSALNILGKIHINDFVAAIEREDEKYLMSFPGVGKKTSRQIILDLKGKLTDLFSHDQVESIQTAQDSAKEEIEETIEALKALGYLDSEIQGIVPDLYKVEYNSTDDLIRTALSLLMKN